MSEAVSRTVNKRVSTACSSCKKAKCKCSGPPSPCEACSGKQRKCVFQITEDKRRKESAENALEAIEARHRSLESLFDRLRSPDDDTVFSLVDAIRKGSELQTLLEQQEELKTSDEDFESVAGPSGRSTETGT
ncbi:hypothetical protein ABW20_dc0100793 [Dactylellina cionopaga]|nr:hypothetical protein ABW20_dc0100793 [Dactylellina cionopaga]